MRLHPTIDSNIAAGWQHRRRWISILTREWARRSAFTFGISCAWKRPHRRTVSQVLQSDVLRVWEKLLPRFFQNPRLRYSLCTGKAGYVFSDNKQPRRHPLRVGKVQNPAQHNRIAIRGCIPCVWKKSPQGRGSFSRHKGSRFADRCPI